MKFKEPHLEDQFAKSSMVLQQIVYDFCKYSHQEFGIWPTITRLWDPVPGESGVHPDKRGCDIRDEFMGSHTFTSAQSAELVEFINRKWARNDGFKTCIHHAFRGGPKHFHLQIPISTKAYETEMIFVDNEAKITTKGGHMSEEQKHGVKESKELLIGVNELSLVLMKHLKDGFQAGKDAAAILGELVANEEVKNKLVEAVQGVDKVPAEIKDLSLEEGVELGMVQVGYVSKIVDALKKPEA